MAKLENRVALVTGASRGIGKAIAIALAGAGADVAVNYHKEQAAAEQVCATVQSLGRRAVSVRADVSRVAEVERLVATVEQELGPVEILVNNAGISQVKAFADLVEADWIGLTHSYASLLAKEGITANAIAPALIETDMITSNPNASPARLPLGHLGSPEEIGRIAVLLAESDFLTGQTISPNGGWYMT